MLLKGAPGEVYIQGSDLASINSDWRVAAGPISEKFRSATDPWFLLQNHVSTPYMM